MARPVMAGLVESGVFDYVAVLGAAPVGAVRQVLKVEGR